VIEYSLERKRPRLRCLGIINLRSIRQRKRDACAPILCNEGDVLTVYRGEKITHHSLAICYSSLITHYSLLLILSSASPADA
jgi:hypothetical protein